MQKLSRNPRKHPKFYDLGTDEFWTTNVKRRVPSRSERPLLTKKRLQSGLALSMVCMNFGRPTSKEEFQADLNAHFSFARIGSVGAVEWGPGLSYS
jgi:hypothetical protein